MDTKVWLNESLVNSGVFLPFTTTDEGRPILAEDDTDLGQYKTTAAAAADWLHKKGAQETFNQQQKWK
jgi:hypothetical protein